MMASNWSGGNCSSCWRASCWANSHSPLCACREPQQSCFGGVMTSQPLRARTSTVSRLMSQDQVLGAADEHRDPMLPRANRGRDGRDQLSGELGLDVRRDAFELLDPFGQELENAASANKCLQAELLVDPQNAAHEAQVAQVHEKPAYGKRSDKVPLGRFEHAAGFGFGARVLEKLGVIDARGASRHAGKAAEAEIHLVREGLRRVQAAIGNGAHERDATARAVALDLRRV